jgi:hypothetical protein
MSETNPDIIRFTTQLQTQTDFEKVVIATIEVYEAGSDDDAEYLPTIRATGTAVCHPDDKFDFRIGQMLAYARAQKRAAKALARGAIDLWEDGQRMQKAAYSLVGDVDG